MGGMAAFIPSRQRPGDERAGAGRACGPTRSVRSRRAMTGPGWPTPTSFRRRARCSSADCGGEPNQLERRRDDVHVTRRRSSRTLPPRPGEITEAGPAHQRQRRLPVPLLLADRPRRGGDQLADGGRGHGRDLADPDLAVGPPRSSSQTAARSPPSWYDEVLDEETAKNPRGGRRGDVAARAPGRDAGAVRPGGAVPGADRVPDAPGLPLPGLTGGSGLAWRDRRTQPGALGRALLSSARATTRRCCLRALAPIGGAVRAQRPGSAPG